MALVMKKYAIIVAGGSGSRMNAEIPKQFITFNSKPILMHTINAFYQIDSIEIIVVLPENNIDKWNDLCKGYNFTVPHKVAIGGNERFHSVQKGLKLCSNDGLVAIHDGVRPFVSKTIIENAFKLAEKVKAAIPVVEIHETLRQINANGSKTVERSNYRLAQTPQAFDLELLKKAYEQEYTESFTDDASVIEALGVKVQLFEGDRRNIKITTPSDIILANAFVPFFKHCN